MAHNNYYLDLCVDTYVVNESSVLLRFHEKYNFWGTPGGHVDPGQDVNEAALREVQEEAGLDVELVGPSTCCLLYTSPSPRDATLSRMPSSA